MKFYVYRERNTVKIKTCAISEAKTLANTLGSANLGTRPYESEEDAELYRKKWQAKVDADPRAKPPYSIEKD